MRVLLREEIAVGEGPLLLVGCDAKDRERESVGIRDGEGEGGWVRQGRQEKDRHVEQGVSVLDIPFCPSSFPPCPPSPVPHNAIIPRLHSVQCEGRTRIPRTKDLDSNPFVMTTSNTAQLVGQQSLMDKGMFIYRSQVIKSSALCQEASFLLLFHLLVKPTVPLSLSLELILRHQLRLLILVHRFHRWGSVG